MILLKLGGSLITDKTRPESAREETIDRLAQEIFVAQCSLPELRLVVGHGSGSFGHHQAARFNTHEGADTPEAWRGFSEVWASARRLNELVMRSLEKAGTAAMAFPPSAACVCEGGRIVSWPLEPIERALQAGLLPVIYGDVAFDRRRGSSIVSTEQLFAYLAERLQPKAVLFAGLAEGVFANPDEVGNVLAELKEQDLARIDLGGSHGPDVTGGMQEKVRQAIELARMLPGAQVRIFSGEQPGALLAALKERPLGTRILS